MKKLFFTLISSCLLGIAFAQVAQPRVSAIQGRDTLCSGSGTQLTNSHSGGKWSTDNSAVATVSDSGFVHGVSSGVANITYTVDSFPPVTQNFIVKGSPTVTGDNSVFKGASITLTGTPAGGTWASSTVAVATVVTGTGVVTGVAEGSTAIAYSATNGCQGYYTVTVMRDPTIVMQPKNSETDKSNNASFFLSAKGTSAINYQWQFRADSNFSFTNVPATGTFVGANNSVLNIMNPDKGMLHYQYRCVASETGGNADTSRIVSLGKINKSKIDTTTTAKSFSDSTHYRFLIGTNYDFVNGKQPLSLYYHLQFFLPGAYGRNPKGKENGGRRFGFVAGFYQNRQVSQLDDNFTHYVNGQGNIFKDSVILNTPIAAAGDSTKYARVNSVNYTATKSSTITGLYFEPTYRLWHVAKGTDVYALGHLDMLYNVTEIDTSFTYKTSDTVYLHESSVKKYTKIYDSASKNTVVNYQFYYGGGLLLQLKNKTVDTYIKMMSGVASLGYKTDWYYGTELAVNILPLNVTFGVEYRGLYSQGSPSYFNVYASKVFSLSKLASIITQ